MLQAFDLHIQAGDVKATLKKYDINEDGKLSFAEISILLIKVLKSLIEEGKLSDRKLKDL